MTNCQHFFLMGSTVTDPTKYNCKIISPVTEYMFLDSSMDSSLNAPQKFFKEIYKKYREDKTVAKLRNDIYNKCIGDLEFFKCFLFIAYHLAAKSVIYGIDHVGVRVASDILNLVRISPSFPITNASYFQMKYHADSGDIELVDSNDVTVQTSSINNQDAYGQPLLKNLLERIFIGIFIRIFTHEMGDGNYYNILKINSNSSQYGVSSPMEKSKTDFNNMNEWLDTWRQTEFSWNILWEGFANYVENYRGKYSTFKILEVLLQLMKK